MNSFKLIIIALFISLQACAQSVDNRLIGLESEIENLMNAYHTVGLSVGIVKDGKVIFCKGFGHRDLEKKLPVTQHTIFGIGSITKQFTTSLLGKYRGQGKLTFDDKPSQFIKGLKFYNKEMDDQITIKHLMTHTSGIGNVDGAHVFFPTDNIDYHLARLRYLVPNGEIGNTLNYSNMGMTIVGAIGEKITNKSWGQNVKDDLFTPLGMTSSITYLQELKNSEDYSFGYGVIEETPVKVLIEDQHESAPSGAIHSSVSDMSKWILMLLNQGKYEEIQVVPTDFLEEAWTPHTSFPAFDFGDTSILNFNLAGYGWFIQPFQNYYRVNHSGGTSGFTANLDLFPNENLGIIVLTNQSNSAISYNITEMIATRILALPIKKWDEFEVRYAEARTFSTNIPPINEENKPLLPLKSFCGIYENKGYGQMKVTLENENLYAALPAFKLALVHHENNTFYTQSIEETHQNNPSFYYHFLTDEVGEINSISVGMQSEAVIFEKK